MSDDQTVNLAKLMDVAMLRSRVHTANLANQNTPGYHARAVSFENEFRAALAAGNDVDEVEPKIFEPLNTAQGNDGNDVDVDHEVTASAQNTMLYNTYAALLRGQTKILNTAISASP
jgi:flagellar basal-body rod protein FlgB